MTAKHSDSGNKSSPNKLTRKKWRGKRNRSHKIASDKFAGRRKEEQQRDKQGAPPKRVIRMASVAVSCYCKYYWSGFTFIVVGDYPAYSRLRPSSHIVRRSGKKRNLDYQWMVCLVLPQAKKHQTPSVPGFGREARKHYSRLCLGRIRGDGHTGSFFRLWENTWGHAATVFPESSGGGD